MHFRLKFDAWLSFSLIQLDPFATVYPHNKGNSRKWLATGTNVMIDKKSLEAKKSIVS